MDIVIIGSGNVAAVLGRKLKAAGHTILQILSRNATAASELAYEWDSESANYASVINQNADVYLIAVSDNAIESIAHDLKLPGKIVAHTAAAVSKDVLKNISDNYGIFYPFQSLRKEMPNLPDIPFYIDGSNSFTKNKLEELAHSISDRPPVNADDEQRMKLHICAVLVSNFVNHLYVLAEKYCEKEGIDFAQLLPLIEETALRLSEVSPKEAQTGPAIRHDEETIQKHLQLLNGNPSLQHIYRLLTESIQQGK